MSVEILVVDDSRTIRATIRLFLRGTDYSITDAENGKEALDILASRSFDLILTDLNMPVLDGFALIGAARSLPTTERTPVVVMTTRDEEEDVQRAFDQGATAYLNKPLEKQELLIVLSRHTGTGSG